MTNNSLSQTLQDLVKVYNFNVEMLKHKIDYQTTRKIHETGVSSPIETEALIGILQKGRKDMKPRPFIKLFEENLDLESALPTYSEITKTSFNTIAKNIEDNIDSQFASAISSNKLGLAELKYRKGIPIVLTGSLVKSIRWKVVKNEN